VSLPASHPLRYELHDEVHARPPLPLRSPARVSMLALLSPPAARERELAALRALAELHGVAFAAASGGHVSFDCGEFRVKWERHTEFSRYVFLREGPGAPFERSALDYVPADWVAALPGELLHAAHAEIVPAAPTQTPQIDTASDAYFGGRPVVGSIVAGGAAVALTDFRIDANGYSRIVLFDRGLTPPQTGRAVQALFEVDTYRMLALLAFPMARELSPRIARDERELSEVANVLVNVAEADEPVLLDRLTTLQAHIERHEADNHYRSVSRARRNCCRPGSKSPANGKTSSCSSRWISGLPRSCGCRVPSKVCRSLRSRTTYSASSTISAKDWKRVACRSILLCSPRSQYCRSPISCGGVCVGRARSPRDS
jgi:uncharacterized membrane-anchored protein